MNSVLWFLGGHGGTPTNLWGGIVSDLSIIGAVLGMYWKHKCHERRCHRLAKHQVEGTPYTVCRKHHPTVPNRAVKGDIGRAHDQAQRIAAVRIPPPAAPVAEARGRKLWR